MPNNLNKNWFIIRADANTEIGIGHVIRCLALAEWLLDINIKPVLLTKHQNGFIESKIKALGGEMVLLTKSRSLSTSVYKHSSWLRGTEEEDAMGCMQSIFQLAQDNHNKPLFIMVDHYSLGAPWERILQEVAPVLAVDDLSDRVHECRWLIDQTYGKTYEDYCHLVQDETQVFLGPEYSLLRKEFSKEAENLSRTYKEENIHILMSLGGVDKNNDTSKILKLLAQYKDFEALTITIVTGSANPNRQDLENLIHRMSNVSLQIDCNNMAFLMKTHDICIGAAGSTSWERCALSIPTLCVVLADNQKTIAENMHLAGALLNLGLVENIKKINFLSHLEALCNDKSLYNSLSQNAYKLCDGLGCQRIIKEVIN